MTYGELITKICKTCPYDGECVWQRGTAIKSTCLHLEDIIHGWELGQMDAFEKASEWLKKFCDEHIIIAYSDNHEIDNSKELIEIFKSKMEE